MIFSKKNPSLKLITIKEFFLFKKFFNKYFLEILNSNIISIDKINFQIKKIKNNRGKINWIIDKKRKIGFIIFFLNKKKNYCYIRDYFILENFRKKKIGSIIIEKLIIYCKKKKFKFIKIDIIDKNKKVFKFWNKLSFKKNKKSYYLKLNK